MATRTFEIRTEPHRAKLGDTELLFLPEVLGAEFAQMYDEVVSVQAKIKTAQGGKGNSSKHASPERIDASLLIELSQTLRRFSRTFMLSDSQSVFDDMRVPDRVLVQLMEWVAELYGSGSGNQGAAGGPSSD